MIIRFWKFFALIVICLATSASVWSQKLTPVKIFGHADFAAGEEIRLLVYEDLLTYTPRVAASSKIAADGQFELSCTTPQVLLAQLEIRTSKAEFFIEPSHSYDLTIDMDPKLFNLYAPQDYDGFLHIVNNNPDKQDLNSKINYFSRFYNALFERFSFKILYDHDAAAYDSVQSVMNEKFDVRNNPYDFYQAYQFYEMSNLDRIYWQKEGDSLFNKYLNNDHILYNHPSYMNLFNSFYDDYVFMSAKIKMETILACINQNANYRQLFDALGADEFLVNERIRELVIIKSLGQLYLNHPEFDKNNIVALLQEIRSTSHFPEHKPLVENMLRFVSKFSDEQLVKEVKLKEGNGKDFSFKKMKGNWVYVYFFRTDCLECVREMQILREINEKFKDSLSVVSVCVDFDKYKLQNLLNKYPQFDWKFVYFNQQYEWLSQLEVNALPDYLLLSPEGEIYERYLPAPSNGMMDYLTRLFMPEAEKDKNPMFQDRNK